MNQILHIGYLPYLAQVEFVGRDNARPALARLMNRRLVANLQKLAYRLSVTPHIPDNSSEAYAAYRSIELPAVMRRQN